MLPIRWLPQPPLHQLQLLAGFFSLVARHGSTPSSSSASASLARAAIVHPAAPSWSRLQVKGDNETVNVKRLPKKPAPPRFGCKLTARQLELATHICVDCGYIYCDE